MTKIVSAALLLVMQVTSTYGATLVDTGSPAISSNGAVAVGKTQWMGVRFNLADSYNLTDIKSYFFSSGSSFGTLTLSLKGDSFGLPGVELYSQEFLIPANLGKNWFGVSDINWQVASGDYWVTYEVRDTQTYTGSLEFPAPSLLTAAVKNDYYTDWTILNNHGFGLIVSGEPVSSVPEPLAIYQMAVGLIAVFVLTRRRPVVLSNC